MKEHVLPAIRLTVVCIIVFIVLYPALIWVVAKAAPAQGKGEEVVVNNKVVGYKLEGQSFTEDRYFWGRPSAVSYNAAGSAGSNKGPSNPDYLQVVNDRIDSFIAHNPTIKKEQIPSDIVTASGSGLDPDISLQGALIQANRVAGSRGITPNNVEELIKQHVKKNMSGIERVNVLELNVALDALKK